eukprot:14315995-Ditylum_brightwellii.AAC.1
MQRVCMFLFFPYTITKRNWQLVGQVLDSSCWAYSFGPIFHKVTQEEMGITQEAGRVIQSTHQILKYLAVLVCPRLLPTIVLRKKWCAFLTKVPGKKVPGKNTLFNWGNFVQKFAEALPRKEERDVSRFLCGCSAEALLREMDVKSSLRYVVLHNCKVLLAHREIQALKGAALAGYSAAATCSTATRWHLHIKSMHT